LLNVVDDILSKKSGILGVAKKHKTPFYLLDDKGLKKSIVEFSSAFKKYLPSCLPCYAIKANHHPYILESVVKAGFGLEVGSGREFKLALEHKPSVIIHNGPGKTEEELMLVVKNNKVAIVNFDSFSELEKLGKLAQRNKKFIKAGVRVSALTKNSWGNFGIPLKDLKSFFQKAKKYKYIQLQGIHFHLSWNTNTEKYEENIKNLSICLKKNFSKEDLRSIKFIDLGGGFYPNKSEGYYPWSTRRGRPVTSAALMKLVDSALGLRPVFKDKYYLALTTPIDKFAKDIASYVAKFLSPIISCNYYTEPGRIICYNAMHSVVRVVDVKRKDFVIVDGGENMQGSDYGDNFYFPIVNLSNFSRKELNCTVQGPLCTPLDVWGHYCYAKKIQEGDVIVIPNQGAYTYSLAQNFIKPIPDAYHLKS